MKLTRDQLHESDRSLIFTQNPDKFFEALLLNLMWAKGEKDEAITIANMQFAFEEWLKLYTTKITDDIAFDKFVTYKRGVNAGMIEALTDLPLKNGLFGKKLDFATVARLLKTLKAQEPIRSE